MLNFIGIQYLENWYIKKANRRCSNKGFLWASAHENEKILVLISYRSDPGWEDFLREVILFRLTCILVIFLLLSKQTILTIYCISVCVNITLFALLSLLIRPKKKKLSKSSNFSESWNLRKEHWFVKTHVQRKKCPKLSKEYTRWSIHKIMRFLKSLK